MSASLGVAVASLWLMTSATWCRADSNAVYFVFVEWPSPSRDSFVALIKRPDLIEFARSYLMPNSTNEQRFALVRIAAGRDGINRDYLAPGAPQWSWHVVEFIDFAEAVGESIMTTPSFIETHLTNWIASHNGLAAFPHKPAMELKSLPPLSAWMNGSPGRLRLTWSDLGVQYVYTVEVSDSMTGNWSPAPGGAWPITATDWLDTAVRVSGTRFYRVRAELKNQ